MNAMSQTARNQYAATATIGGPHASLEPIPEVTTNSRLGLKTAQD